MLLKTNVSIFFSSLCYYHFLFISFICLFPNFEIDIFVHWLFTTIVRYCMFQTSISKAAKGGRLIFYSRPTNRNGERLSLHHFMIACTGLSLVLSSILLSSPIIMRLSLHHFTIACIGLSLALSSTSAFLL